MTYELFYATGGHGGPYPDVETAVRRAMQILRGSRTERSIAVYKRTPDGLAGYGPQVARVFKALNFETTGALQIEPPMVIEPEPDQAMVSFDWFVSAVRVELKKEIDEIKRLIQIFNSSYPDVNGVPPTHLDKKQAELLQAKMHGIMIAESKLIAVMRQRT